MAMTEKKYCILPGREPLRLANTSGHSVIIGEEPRTIPDFFEAEAIYGGAVSEEQLADLKERLLGGIEVKPAPAPEKKSHRAVKAAAVAPDAPPVVSAELKAAVIEIMNNGNPEDFDHNGAPKCAALTWRLGREVTGPERDAAWREVIQ